MSPSPWRSRATAALPAVLLIAVDIAVGGNLLRDDSGWRLGGSVAVAGVLGLAVLLRRWWPVPVLVFVLAMSSAAAFLGVLWDPFAAAALVLYVVALGRDRLLPLLGACAVAAVAGFAAWWYLLGVPLLVAAWAAGRAAHAHRAQAERLERQRQHQIRIDERLRIARELHDVVTHGMGLIAVKAGVANHVARSRPEEAREALRVIEETSREALGEMRRLLSALRDDTEPPGGLADLPRLAERTAPAGVTVELDVDAADLPQPVELAAFRIVQEAVTNVVKHAAPARCRVVVRANAGEVRIEVTDDGARPRGPVRPGHGIVGMTERAALYGGELTAEPLPDKGFRVRASLRYEPAEVPVA
ncbi:two-component sensor histidine kinase [Amycolatopsis deserti]|uniref:histidine kinase n=1 Tax=Amycolatopsis deserti TaxID=185696 RepID=A0ABQ3IRZ0_9PSEU|nr:sensor histidine kinase [Amycolatopsis deserti]GHE92600.1 two-component sensor histidine kinase [Amycolatopsis deserti]